MGRVYHDGVWSALYPPFQTYNSCLDAVDQPAGTGFSYTSTERYVHSMDEVIIYCPRAALPSLISCILGTETVPSIPPAVL